jgi:hypothetical protein
MERAMRWAKRTGTLLRDMKAMEATRVTDVDAYIKLVTTRTKAIELLRRFQSDPEVSAFLSELEEHK